MAELHVCERSVLSLTWDSGVTLTLMTASISLLLALIAPHEILVRLRFKYSYKLYCSHLKSNTAVFRHKVA